MVAVEVELEAGYAEGCKSVWAASIVVENQPFAGATFNPHCDQLFVTFSVGEFSRSTLCSKS